MSSGFLTVIVGMTLVTYLTRFIPLLLCSRLKLRPFVLRWLRLIPAAVLASLLAPELLINQGSLQPWNIRAVAALPAFLIAARSRNLLLTVLTGLATVAVLRLF